jgi:hypothetical protein
LKAERARFLSVGEESGAVNRASFSSLGKKMRVFGIHKPEHTVFSTPSLIFPETLL